jgi:peptidoglycan/xylan/chitin deacetylase (PgdA/CDA1 family)
MRIANRALRTMFVSAGSSPVFWPLLRSRATILMLHRFRMPDVGVEGHDPQTLRNTLAILRRERYELLSLETVMRDLAEGRKRMRPSVAFTIDDGYFDHAAAAPVFAEFDCPVTTFVTTGFLDRRLWLWWDRIEYVFENTGRKSISVALGGNTFHYALGTSVERRIAQDHFTSQCKEISEALKHAALKLLALSAEVDVPVAAPPRYAPMSWDDLRRCETMTMTFGPHTVTHPVLARTSDVQARYEITESWNRLRCEAKRALPVFCYPNGRPEDFSDRETTILADLGFLGAVTGSMGYARAAKSNSGKLERYRVRRFAYPDSVGELLVLVSGAERFKQIIRGTQ